MDRSGFRLCLPGRGWVRRLAAPSILRLSLGRRATPAERREFVFGFTERFANMPPLFQGLLGLREGREGLLRSAELAWHRDRAANKGRPEETFSPLAGNIFSAWTGEPLGFLHFEKCGGCALLTWLARFFHPEQIHADVARDLPPHLYTRLVEGRVPQPLIWGHYDMPTLRRFDPGRKVFTLLREPRARLTSLYQYWRGVNPAKIDPEISFAVGYAHRLSFEDFLNHDDPCLSDLIDNVYVRRLTGFYQTGTGADRLRAAPEEALGLALEKLEGLFFVGITERLDKSAARLAHRLNIAPPQAGLRDNVTEENHLDPSGWFRKVARGATSPSAKAALERRTTLDRQLYESAARRFEETR